MSLKQERANPAQALKMYDADAPAAYAVLRRRNDAQLNARVLEKTVKSLDAAQLTDAASGITDEISAVLHPGRAKPFREADLFDGTYDAGVVKANELEKKRRDRE